MVIFLLLQEELSDASRVLLRGLTLNSTGLYRCEVSAEAPNFSSVQGEGRMDIVCKYCHCECECQSIRSHVPHLPATILLYLLHPASSTQPSKCLLEKFHINYRQILRA